MVVREQAGAAGMTATCKTCRWWEGKHQVKTTLVGHEVTVATCKGQPPTPRAGAPMFVWSPPVWPETAADDYCGHHEPNETSDT